MKQEQLNEVLRLHEKWLNGDRYGVRANLREANLFRANLFRANLREADLDEANLREANLREANLDGANLFRANLREANLREADLDEADLDEANLFRANLREANLFRANLFRANLREADLDEANLREANLRKADLREADLSEANLPDFTITPEEGSFVAFKATNEGVVKLLIAEDAKRLNSIGSRKCRASKVTVLKGFSEATGTHYKGLVYETGATLEVEDFDDDIRKECTRGIHFFMTRKEAENRT